jgi:hypothetical protein
MNTERLRYMGRRQELLMEKRTLEIRFHGLINNLRDELDPLRSINEMRPDVVATLSAELESVQNRTREVAAELKRISDLIGG